MPLILFLILLVASLVTAEEQRKNYGTPNPNAPTELKTFGQLIGKWSVETTFTDRNGSTQKSTGTWTFYYILEGMAIADDYDAKTTDGQRFYGTTYRLYNPGSKKWECKWICATPLYWMDIEGPAATGKNILLDGRVVPTDGNPILSKIRFTDITANSFTWKSDVSYDGGKTWAKDRGLIKARRID